jgi:hypothetical protein
VQFADTTSGIAFIGIGNPPPFSLAIPNVPVLNGMVIHSQAFGFGSTFNAAFGIGLNTSNNVTLVLGSL